VRGTSTSLRPIQVKLARCQFGDSCCQSWKQSSNRRADLFEALQVAADPEQGLGAFMTSQIIKLLDGSKKLYRVSHLAFNLGRQNLTARLVYF